LHRPARSYMLQLVTRLLPPPPRSTLFPYTTLFRSSDENETVGAKDQRGGDRGMQDRQRALDAPCDRGASDRRRPELADIRCRQRSESTRLNSSHQIISYAVFCLKKKKTN